MSITELLAPGARCMPGDTIALLTGEVLVIAGKGVRSVETRSVAANGSSGEAEQQQQIVVTTKLVATICGVLRKSQILVPLTMALQQEKQMHQHNNNTSGAGAQRNQRDDCDDQQSILQYEVAAPAAKKYFPEVGDFVIGIIAKAVGANSYQVHIASAHLAVLDANAFDGASKHSRPRLIPGDLVYAHVTRADPDLDVVISCISLPHMERKDWVTGEGVFGPLSADNGAMTRVPLQFARELVSNATPVLPLLGRRVPFEVAVGVNGIVWVSNIVKRNSNNNNNTSSSTGGAAPPNNSAANNANQQQQQQQKTSADAAEDRRQVLTLVAIMQCIVGAEEDVTTEQVQARVERHFPGY